MREFKFRAWDPLQKSLFYFGFENLYDSFVNVNSKSTDLSDSTVIVMQYSGLQDKNKKDIYEGDIVRYTIDALDGRGELSEEQVTYTEEVHFHEGCFDLDGCPLSVGADIGEVVGNIHQNADLLPKI